MTGSRSVRERYFLVIGGTVAALTILVTWVIVPVGQKWSRMGDQLQPKLRAVAALEVRARGRESCIARRARLAQRIGSLLDPSQYPKTSKPEEKDSSPSDPEGGAQTGKGEANPRPNDSPQCPLAGELEKTIKKCGGKATLISARKTPKQRERSKHFRIVALQAEVDLNVDSLVKLLHALEKGDRFMRVESLKIRHDLKKPDALSITLDVLAYEIAGEA